MKLIETLLYERFELKIDDDLQFDDIKHTTSKDFLNFCCDELDLKGMFICKIVADRKNNGIITTAFYDEENKMVVVYGKNRMLGDILRSVAHELTHKMQFEKNKIKRPVQDIGGEIEDEANALAGSLIKKFIMNHKSGPNLFE